MRYIKKYNEGIFDIFKRKNVDKKDNSKITPDLTKKFEEKRTNILNKLEEHFKSDPYISDIFKKFSDVSVKDSIRNRQGYIKYNRNIDKCTITVEIIIDDIVNDNFLIVIDISGQAHHRKTLNVNKDEDLYKVISMIKEKLEEVENDILPFIKKVSISKEKYELKLKKIEDYTNNFFNVEFPIDDLKDLLLDINDLLSAPFITKIKDPHIDVIGYTIRWEIDYNPLKIPILKSDNISNMDVDKIMNHYNTIKEYFPLLKELGNRVKSEFGLEVRYHFTNKKEDVYKYLDLSIITGKPDDLLVTKVPYGWE